MAEPAHPTNPLPPDVASEHWPKPVPPHPHGFMTKVDAALEQRSSTFRSDSGKRTSISTTNRITSGDELKQRNGEGVRSICGSSASASSISASLPRSSESTSGSDLQFAPIERLDPAHHQAPADHADHDDPGGNEERDAIIARNVD